MHLFLLAAKSNVYWCLRFNCWWAIQFPPHELLMTYSCKIFITNALKIRYKPIQYNNIIYRKMVTDKFCITQMYAINTRNLFDAGLSNMCMDGCLIIEINTSWFLVNFSFVLFNSFKYFVILSVTECFSLFQDDLRL